MPKTYTTANYDNTGLKDLCWTTTNLAEVTSNAITTFPGQTPGERGYYYPWNEAADTCAALGVEWSMERVLG
ncbi:hypothetical protein AGMMS49525_10190 [Bacteroidia bacterium]|nr:hypothetical protein AGMMS49525_10190 [Bacteroidia bacterium]